MKHFCREGLLVMLLVVVILIHMVSFTFAITTSNLLWLLPVGLTYVVGIYHCLGILFLKHLRKE